MLIREAKAMEVDILGKGASAIAESDMDVRDLLAERRTLVVGHRGAKGLEPENTLLGVRKAIELGADMVEVDVRRCKDGHLVLMHDETVDRTTNGRGKVSELTLSELGSLDAGKGERIPTLEDVLSEVGDRIHIVIELKEPGIGGDALRTVRDHGLLDRVILTSFFHREVLNLKLHERRAVTGIIFACEPANLKPLIDDSKAEVIMANYRYATDEMLLQSMELKIPAFLWTINNEGDMAVSACKAGVRGIVTDYPDVALRALRRAMV